MVRRDVHEPHGAAAQQGREVVHPQPARVDGHRQHLGARRAKCLPRGGITRVFDGHRVSVFMEVEGLGDYLPKYAGNLDIMTAAAARTAEMFAEEILAGRLSLSPAGSAAALATA